MTTPDLGVRTAFSTEVNFFHADFLVESKDKKRSLKSNDRILAIGNSREETKGDIKDWPQLLRILATLRKHPPPVNDESTALHDPSLNHLFHQGDEIVRIRFEPSDQPGTESWVWCRLDRSPLETLLPTVLWFFIKAGLFVVGALVFWKRPNERSARMFFWLSVVSCGAYLGGYHWQAIVTQRVLLLVFITSSVLLPPVSLHFYLVFPRPKPFFERHPSLTLAGLYGPPLAFLFFLLSQYGLILWLQSADGTSSLLRKLLDWMLMGIYVYFGIALILYLLSLASLIYSYRTARDGTERNQVKWILFGSAAALMPLGYSLYLALLEQDKFGGGGATWPMFCASLCVTIAFTISITRYRLMELDKVVSSGAVYFSITAVAALVYYGVVILAVLLLGSRLIAVPTFAQALGVGGTVLVLVVLLDLARGRLKKALDRHFRREKVQLDRTLHRMSQAIAQLVDPPTLARHLLQTTTDLLGVRRGAVYLREGDPAVFRLIDTQGAAPPLTELSPGNPLIEELEKFGLLCLTEPRERVNGLDHGPALRQLHFLGGEVAVPLTHEGQLLALLILGRRTVDAYTSEDLNLLSAFAQVTALALVSGQGGRTIEALNRELKGKVEKIAEQQRRILSLQSQLVRREATATSGERKSAEKEEAATPDSSTSSLAEAITEGIRPPLAAGIIGTSPAVQQLMHVIRKVSSSSSAVLLRGESGTGKELLARAVHEGSPRATRPFVKVHCAALAPMLLESELFGHVKGAFTGAIRDRAGRFENADGGTLFLDEIGDVSWEVQTKLLRVLQEMTFERVGSSETIQVDVRIIAATHQDLERLIQQGRFREDLYYRLNVLPVTVPPLRERREDIPELIQHFLDNYGPRCGKPDLQMDDEVLTLLKAAAWKGNIRQLENVIERAVTIAEGSTITLEDLPPDIVEADPLPERHNGDANHEVPRGIQAERAERDRRDRDQLVRALASTDGNKAEAARLLGLKRSTLISRLKKYGLS